MLGALAASAASASAAASGPAPATAAFDAASAYLASPAAHVPRPAAIPQPRDNEPNQFQASLPIVINTWPFTDATRAAWASITTPSTSAVDAVEIGCTVCEIEQCDGSVGYGGSPNEDGETTLDAMIMDGITHDVGSIGCIKRVKSAISVARKVMEHTTHTLLVGEDATRFAVSMGFKEESLTTNNSISIYQSWKAQNCQPNYRLDTLPDANTSCGPYKPAPNTSNRGSSRYHTSPRINPAVGPGNHDTVGMIVIDANGNVAGGTSTNGASHKVPGRVGDSPITGSGAYVDNNVGGAAATGDGDVMMRFLPSYQAVRNMEAGMTPTAAAEDALRRIAKFYPNYLGALVAVNKQGQFGGAAHGWNFSYSVRNSTMSDVTVFSVTPLDAKP
ncbi:aspartylglucosaminidase [Capsaspora owczarzaki ATCC 30864]|nr:aspartylglucosaminidase [Capsaspora owczarzaki ATCC 30864]|eukprot:XP_004364899.2 aspartylglucosaminidase [Capsaspora owczarzaki ATCC 30864]